MCGSLCVCESVCVWMCVYVSVWVAVCVSRGVSVCVCVPGQISIECALSSYTHIDIFTFFVQDFCLFTVTFHVQYSNLMLSSNVRDFFF